MTCLEIDNVLEAYADGKLDSHVQQEVESHLAICAECACKLKDLSMSRELLHTFALTELPQGLHQRIMARVEENHIRVVAKEPVVAIEPEQLPSNVTPFRRFASPKWTRYAAAMVASLVLIVSIQQYGQLGVSQLGLGPNSEQGQTVLSSSYETYGDHSVNTRGVIDIYAALEDEIDALNVSTEAEAFTLQVMEDPAPDVEAIVIPDDNVSLAAEEVDAMAEESLQQSFVLEDGNSVGESNPEAEPISITSAMLFANDILSAAGQSEKENVTWEEDVIAAGYEADDFDDAVAGYGGADKASVGIVTFSNEGYGEEAMSMGEAEAPTQTFGLLTRDALSVGSEDIIPFILQSYGDTADIPEWILLAEADTLTEQSIIDAAEAEACAWKLNSGESHVGVLVSGRGEQLYCLVQFLGIDATPLWLLQDAGVIVWEDMAEDSSTETTLLVAIVE